MKSRLTVAEAARIMEADPQFIRIAMQRGHLPIGNAEKNSSQWTYYISVYKFSDYTGIPLSEIEKALSATRKSELKASE